MPMVTLSEAELIFTQVWFRHGERAPSHFRRFPNEATDFGKDFPIENGELTMKGRMMEYTIGQTLRTRYDNFIGEEYKPHQIRIYFDSDNRTAECAQLVAAGLFPPSGEQIWNTKLLWQPLAIHEELILKHTSFSMLGTCPKAGKTIKNSKEFQNILRKVDPNFIDFLKSKTLVKDVPNAQALNELVDSLYTRVKINDSRLAAPSWVTREIYEKLDETTNFLHTSFMNLTRLTSGNWHVDRVLNEFHQHLSRPTDLKNKIVLFSGHDTNLMTIGREIGLKEVGVRLPDFGGHLLLELHKISDELYVQAWFASFYLAELKEQTFELCGNPCRFERFVELYGSRKYSDEQWWDYCRGWIQADNRDNSTIAWFIVALIVLLLIDVFLLYKCLTARRAMQRNPELKPLLDPE
ncbi:unnamed protein product, partial [Mesorhabditis belari]|uniref:Uncharacterized protein n=1 Tax=Mesorhabditis belari TaxID=2138241 RepID=A0AAF3FNL7_9BILA